MEEEKKDAFKEILSDLQTVKDRVARAIRKLPRSNALPEHAKEKVQSAERGLLEVYMDICAATTEVLAEPNRKKKMGVNIDREKSFIIDGVRREYREYRDQRK